jgi:hypothetical protein
MKDDIRLMKDDIRLMNDSLLAPAGDAEAKMATVIIRFREQGIVWGHGVVVQAPDHLVGKGDPKYYLVSAAHVLIAIAAFSMKNDQVGNLTLSWLQQTNDARPFVETERGALILHLDYVSDGSRDYGFMELKSMVPEDITSRRMEMKPLMSQSPTVGTCVVAHGMALFRGSVTGVSEKSRFTVIAHSMPGTSGAPIFDNDRQLVGVVHGSSQHRGHAYGKNEDAAAVTYSDTIVVNADNSMHAIAEDKWQLLCEAEDFSLEDLSEKDEEGKEEKEVETEGKEEDEEGKEEKEVETEGKEEKEVETEEKQTLRSIARELVAITYVDKKDHEKIEQKVMGVLREIVKPSAIETKWKDTKDFKLVYVPE